jgi:hypothetical protein
MKKDFWFKFEDYTFYFVDGKYIRDNIYIDYCEGANHARYDWCPDKEFWIEYFTDSTETFYIAIHEFTEYFLMTNYKQDYETAHSHANEVESFLRKNKIIITGFENAAR